MKYFIRLLKMAGIAEKRYIKKLPGGLLMALTPEDHIQRQLLWYGYYEKKFILTWKRLIKTDSVVVDIGANIGYYSLVAAKKAGQVYAFEPYSASFDQLLENVKRNGLQNLECIRMAIGTGVRESTLYIAPPENTGMTGLQPVDGVTNETELVQTINLDEWVRMKEIKKIDLVKIDIEGAEMEALKGMSNTLSTLKPVLMIEVVNELLDRFDTSNLELFRFLEDLGYEAFSIESETTLKKAEQPFEDELILFVPKPSSHIVHRTS